MSVKQTWIGTRGQLEKVLRELTETRERVQTEDRDGNPVIRTYRDTHTYRAPRYNKTSMSQTFYWQDHDVRRHGRTAETHYRPLMEWVTSYGGTVRFIDRDFGTIVHALVPIPKEVMQRIKGEKEAGFTPKEQFVRGNLRAILSGKKEATIFRKPWKPGVELWFSAKAKEDSGIFRTQTPEHELIPTEQLDLRLKAAIDWCQDNDLAYGFGLKAHSDGVHTWKYGSDYNGHITSFDTQAFWVRVPLPKE